MVSNIYLFIYLVLFCSVLFGFFVLLFFVFWFYFDISLFISTHTDKDKKGRTPLHYVTPFTPPSVALAFIYGLFLLAVVVIVIIVEIHPK